MIAPDTGRLSQADRFYWLSIQRLCDFTRFHMILLNFYSLKSLVNFAQFAIRALFCLLPVLWTVYDAR